MSGFKLSVIIPVYNQDKFLESCLQSVAAQSLESIEVIIVDDGSTDRSPNIAREYEEKYPHFTVISQKNKGRSAARNTGLDKADGSYIAFLDSDDFVDPKMYEYLFEAAVSADADLVKCGAILFDDQSREFLNIRRDFDSFTEITSHRELLKLYLNKKIDRVVWNGIYRHGLFENLRFPVNTEYEDQYVTPKVIASTNKYLFIDKNLYYYRKHPGAFSHSTRVSDQIDKVQALNELYRILRNQKLLEDLGAEYSRYFNKNVIGYHNQVIYREPLALKKNCYSIANLIDNEAFEFVLRNEHLTEEEKQFLQIMRRSHYLYFLVQKLSRVKDIALRGDALSKVTKEENIDSFQSNERYKKMIKQYA